MSWLSRLLSGRTFDPEEHGIHINSAGTVIDKKLCLENFKSGGEKLANIWNKLVISGYSTYATYRDPSSAPSLPELSQQ